MSEWDDFRSGGSVHEEVRMLREMEQKGSAGVAAAPEEKPLCKCGHEYGSHEPMTNRLTPGRRCAVQISRNRYCPCHNYSPVAASSPAPAAPAAPVGEREEEIATVRKLVSDSGAFMKNKNFTPKHREDCAREHRIFKRILTKLEKQP